MMGRLIREDREEPSQYRPIVAIGHTKDLTDVQTVDAFLSYLQENGVNVATFQDVYPKLQPGGSRAEVGDSKRGPQMINTVTASADKSMASAASLRYVLITPARNEADFIEKTIQSVIAQTVLPLRWVIVSDGSTDGTDDIVRKYAADRPWIELVRMPERKERHFAGKVHAFNAGQARLKDLDYDVIGNLDADVTFGEGHFEFLLGKFALAPRLGVAGTPFREGSFQYDFNYTSTEHVSGQIQLFKRKCFEDIGGYVPRKIGGIDLVAVTTARMKGWRTQTFLEMAFVHHRCMGTATVAPLIAAFRSGKGDYILGSHPVWQCVRFFYQIARLRYRLIYIFSFAGYVSSMLRRTEKQVPVNFVHFRRTEEMLRLHKIVSRVATVLTFKFTYGNSHGA